jgi:hypothetical protein
MSIRKHKDKQLFCGHDILTEGAFVSQPPNNAGISVRRIVWVTTNCQFTSDMALKYMSCKQQPYNNNNKVHH